MRHALLFTVAWLAIAAVTYASAMACASPCQRKHWAYQPALWGASLLWPVYWATVAALAGTLLIGGGAEHLALEGVAMILPATPSDWEEAVVHLTKVRGTYEEAYGMPGLHVGHMLNEVIAPLMNRYYRGERTPELHAAMMAVR